MPNPVPEQMRVRRHPERSSYANAEAAAILDAAFVCHVGTVRNGRPIVLPTLYARADDQLLLHGSTAAGQFRDLRTHPDVCVTVTIVDALVLARSVFNHSVNYRSVVVHGQASEVTGDAAKLAALQAFTEQVAPGQWDTARQPSADELRQTSVWAVPLTSASVKVRSGPPSDEEADRQLPVWAGLVPLALRPGTLAPDEHVPTGMAPPVHLQEWGRR